MFDPVELTVAIEIHGCSYRLLRWVRDEVEQGQLRFFAKHGPLEDTEAVHSWLTQAYDALPDDARPPAREPKTIRQFANYFTSFLLVSFTVDQGAGRHTEESGNPCPCPVCTQLAQAARLVPVRVGARAKQTATVLSVAVIKELAMSVGQALPEHDARQLLEMGGLRRPAALVAYTKELLARVEGRSGNESSLALWRRFAYDDNGAPLKGFALTTAGVEDAVSCICSSVRVHFGL